MILASGRIQGCDIMRIGECQPQSRRSPVSPRTSGRGIYTYTTWYPLPVDNSAFGIHHTREGRRHGRIHAKSFVEHRKHVIKSSHAANGDFVLVLETCT